MSDRDAFLKRIGNPWWVADSRFWACVLPPILIVLIAWLLSAK
jgi:hypothetical protein